jgi:ABC-2 type transport system permease protein
MIINRIKKLFHQRDILTEMTFKQFRASYSGAMLGLWWAIIIPFILAVCINIIFTNVFKINIENFTFFVLSGILPWLFFSAAVVEATNSFLTDAAMFRQKMLPLEFVPFKFVLSNFLSFLIGIVFLLPFFIISNNQVITVLPALIFVFIFNLIFILGLSLIFAVLNVYSRDIIHFLSVGLMVWFWITPVFYSLNMVPYPYRWISILNPMTYYITSYRSILFYGKLPSWPVAVTGIVLALIFMAAGSLFLIKKEPSLLKRL